MLKADAIVDSTVSSAFAAWETDVLAGTLAKTPASWFQADPLPRRKPRPAIIITTSPRATSNAKYRPCDSNSLTMCTNRSTIMAVAQTTENVRAVSSRYGLTLNNAA